MALFAWHMHTYIHIYIYLYTRITGELSFSFDSCYSTHGHWARGSVVRWHTVAIATIVFVYIQAKHMHHDMSLIEVKISRNNKELATIVGGDANDNNLSALFSSLQKAKQETNDFLTTLVEADKQKIVTELKDAQKRKTSEPLEGNWGDEEYHWINAIYRVNLWFIRY